MNEVLSFKHPGGVLGPKQIESLKTVQSRNDTYSKKAFAKLKSTTPLDYKPCVIKHVNIAPYGKGQGHAEFTNDCTQAYLQVLMWIITNDKRHCDVSIKIIKAWCQGCEKFEGSNAPLEAAWGITALVRATELLKYTWNGWNGSTSETEKHLIAFIDKLMWPVLTTRYNEIIRWKNNWILTIIEALLQISIFKNDLKTFNKYIKDYRDVCTCCIHPSGQNTETKRDLMHCAFQIGSQVQIAEMCHHQGLNLYECLYKTLEYHAGILNGVIPEDVKHDELKYVWFTHSAWTIGLNHFENRIKRPMPQLRKMIERHTPEQALFNWGPGWVHFQTS
jgi:hypothetical protein